MEIISLKLDKNMLKNLDSVLKKHNFSTRTEFVRDAIREKLEALRKDEVIEQIMKSKDKEKLMEMLK